MLKSILPLSFATFLSRISGLIRDFMLYATFGAGALLDLFWVAYKLPNMTRRFFAEGAFQQALLPQLAELKKHGEEDYQILVFQAWVFIIVTMGLFSLTGILFPKAWVYLLAPGILKSPDHVQLLSALSWTAPYGLFMALSAFYGAFLQLEGQYMTIGLSPLFLNIVLIILLYQTYFHVSIHLLSQGIFVAGVLQCLCLWWSARNLLPQARWSTKLSPAFFKLIRSFGKLSIVGLFIQGNMIIDQVFLSWMPQGTISQYNLCERMFELPLGVIVYSISMIFTSHYVKHHSSVLKRTSLQINVLLLVFYLVIPCFLGLMILADPILKMFLIDSHTIEQTVPLLQVFSLAIVFMTLSKIYMTIATIKNHHNLIVKIHALGFVVNILFDLLLYRFGATGIAVATILTICCQLSFYHRYIPLLKGIIRIPRKIFMRPLMALAVLGLGCLLIKMWSFQGLSLMQYRLTVIGLSGLLGIGYLLLIYPSLKFIQRRSHSLSIQS